jgi:phage tail P2-like protein
VKFDRSLLPPGYPRYGQAVDQAAAHLYDVPVPIRDVWNPATCPEVALPFLAWALSVDVWDASWSTEKKRAVCAASFDLHRHKGTLGGIKDHVALVGSTITVAVTPPAASYLSPDDTTAEREAYLASLPQLRLYEQWPLADDSQATFWNDVSGEWFDDESGPVLFELDDTAAERSGTFAEFVDGGVTTPLERNAMKIDGNRYDVMLAGDGSGDAFADGFMDDPREDFLAESTAATRFYSFSLAEASAGNRMLWAFDIHPGGYPVNTEPEHVAELGYDPAGVYSDLPIAETGDDSAGEPAAAAAFFIDSTAGERLYQVVYFFVAGRVETDSRGLCFLDDARFGIDNFTAELSAVIPGYRPPWVADDYIDGFMCDDDLTALWAACDAIVAAKAERDCVLVRTSIFKPMEIGEQLLVGTPLLLGELSPSWR